ncbi:hypothetical protein [Lutibacter flavus]|uniref:Tetratricopeptide repeat-containing protein n=1 Tax=Lutibacter flavus TaxID=691689 RepID=A0A238Z6Y9_9FLAO|nr:hypothetical protein [Lutibacter flavus]SNR78681.1 hypothetical protein SAMN04488111_3082 [Lutibacter flavus]
MNSTDFTFLMQNTATIDALKTEQLNVVINEYPYFQLARALQLKGLNKTNNFKYNQALKKTGAYTIDRKVLFDFITSQKFISKTNHQIEILEEIDVIEPETIEILHKKITDSFIETTKEVEINEIKEKEPITIVDSKEKATELLEIGKPIDFKSAEPHSFNEWMQLISREPIQRETPVESPKETSKNESKFNLIDKFIQSNPKIKPIDKNSQNLEISNENSDESESIMTETLAKVYLEQKKYDNAIKAYRILSLKYPEKSSFFANRIKAIKILQKNKS